VMIENAWKRIRMGRRIKHNGSERLDVINLR
jgi:hypothetical protein